MLLTRKNDNISKMESSAILQPLEIHHLAHDLRGPLNSVLGFTELLLEGIEGPLNEHQEADIAAVHQSSRNLLYLINTVIDLSKAEAERLKFSFQPVDMYRTLGKILETDFGTVKPSNVELVANKPPSAMEPVWGDPDRVEQMIICIIRFMFTIKRSGQIAISIQRQESDVLLRVYAEDVVISSDHLDELFKPVARIEETGHSKLGRGGLELPLSKLLAEAHQGDLWVETEEGIGTIFYLRLPMYEKMAN